MLIENIYQCVVPILAWNLFLEQLIIQNNSYIYSYAILDTNKQKKMTNKNFKMENMEA